MNFYVVIIRLPLFKKYTATLFNTDFFRDALKFKIFRAVSSLSTFTTVIIVKNDLSLFKNENKLNSVGKWKHF